LADKKTGSIGTVEGDLKSWCQELEEEGQGANKMVYCCEVKDKLKGP
jgi:hypothetical protein